MKTCNKCKQVKPIDDFPLNKTHKDGHGNSCLICQREYTKNHYFNNKFQYLKRNKRRVNEIRDFILLLRKENPCEICGEARWWVLDFHHKDGKTDDIARLIPKGFKAVKDELKKCIIVCANCHRDIHYKCAHSITE